MYSTSGFVSFKSYGDWHIVDEIDYMLTDTTTRSHQSINSDDDSSYSADTYDSYFSPSKHDLDLDRIVAEKINKINKETNDDIKKIRNKLNKIDSSWDEDNFKKYTENNNLHPELINIDRLLGEAMKEVVELKKGANMAVLELTKSVNNVEQICSNTLGLNDSTNKFRKTVYKEKLDQPMSWTQQVWLAMTAYFGIQFLFFVLK